MTVTDTLYESTVWARKESALTLLVMSSDHSVYFFFLVILKMIFYIYFKSTVKHLLTANTLTQGEPVW